MHKIYTITGKVALSSWVLKISVVCAIISITLFTESRGATAENLFDKADWKEGYASCSANSPFINRFVLQNSQSRPLMKIGEMQAWVTQGENGKPTIALTTEGGMTIVGRIFGPQGEDISAALLATVADEKFPSPYMTAPVLSSKKPPVVLPRTQTAAKPKEILQSTPEQNAVANLTKRAPAQAIPSTVVANRVRPPALPSVGIASTPTEQEQKNLNALFAQAGDERMYFSAGTPKVDAPVVYMVADPECPHCQWTIDKYHGVITSGDVDFRIIAVPITSQASLPITTSIFHQNDVAGSFMAHMTSKTKGTKSVTPMDMQQADQNVIQGLVGNVQWIRANGIRSVPFFIYQTKGGAAFSAGDLPQNFSQIAVAQAR